MQDESGNVRFWNVMYLSTKITLAGEGYLLLIYLYCGRVTPCGIMVNIGPVNRLSPVWRKPLHESMLAYCQLYFWEDFSVKFFFSFTKFC